MSGQPSAKPVGAFKRAEHQCQQPVSTHQKLGAASGRAGSAGCILAAVFLLAQFSCNGCDRRRGTSGLYAHHASSDVIATVFGVFQTSAPAVADASRADVGDCQACSTGNERWHGMKLAQIPELLRRDVLNLGCGRKHLPTAVNLDITATTSPDIVHDLNVRPWPFP